MNDMYDRSLTAEETLVLLLILIEELADPSPFPDPCPN